MFLLINFLLIRDKSKLDKHLIVTNLVHKNLTKCVKKIEKNRLLCDKIK
jgi:hypothetical protein